MRRRRVGALAGFLVLVLAVGGGAAGWFLTAPARSIDCAACESACPVTAIFHEDDVPSSSAAFVESAREFFSGAPIS